MSSYEERPCGNPSCQALGCSVVKCPKLQTVSKFKVDKATGETLEQVEAAADSNYGMMTYIHEGRQYIMLQTGPKLTTRALADF